MPALLSSPIKNLSRTSIFDVIDEISALKAREILKVSLNSETSNTTIEEFTYKCVGIYRHEIYAASINFVEKLGLAGDPKLKIAQKISQFLQSGIASTWVGEIDLSYKAEELCKILKLEFSLGATSSLETLVKAIESNKELSEELIQAACLTQPNPSIYRLEYQLNRTVKHILGQDPKFVSIPLEMLVEAGQAYLRKVPVRLNDSTLRFNNATKITVIGEIADQLLNAYNTFTGSDRGDAIQRVIKLWVPNGAGAREINFKEIAKQLHEGKPEIVELLENISRCYSDESKQNRAQRPQLREELRQKALIKEKASKLLVA